MIFRSKDYSYSAYYHRLTEDDGKVYCRALGAVTEKEEDFCRKCPLSAEYGSRHICFYFDLTHDEDFPPEKEKQFHDGIIHAGITPRFPLFSALSERWGEMNNNAFLDSWEHSERVEIERALNEAAEKYKDQPEKMRDCIERAYEISIKITRTDRLGLLIEEILRDTQQKA